MSDNAEIEDAFEDLMDRGSYLYVMYEHIRKEAQRTNTTISLDRFLQFAEEIRIEKYPDDIHVDLAAMRRIYKVGFISANFPDETRRLFNEAPLRMRIGVFCSDEESREFGNAIAFAAAASRSG